MQGKETQITDTLLFEIEHLYNTGLNRKEVSNSLGITEWTVRKALKNKFRNNTEWSCFTAQKKEDILSNEQYQCILGTLLGDASLTSRRNTWEYQVSHCLAQKEYAEHIGNVLYRNVQQYTKNSNSFSPGSLYFRVNYGNKATLAKIAKQVLVNKKKVVTENWINSLDSLGITYWYMDDGSSSRYSQAQVKVSFSSLSFNTLELQLLRDKLSSLGINTSLAKHSKNTKNEQQYTIEVNSRSINDFMDMIEPHILPCFKYKVKRKCNF